MDDSFYLSAASFSEAEHRSESYHWLGHIPFAFWIVEATQPDRIVELGTHTGKTVIVVTLSCGLDGELIRSPGMSPTGYFYNGNGFGRASFGYAVAEDSGGSQARAVA
jgi:hypothetical protein